MLLGGRSFLGGNACIAEVSFLFNVAITIFPESSAHPLRFLLHPLGEGRPDISFQVRASVHLFHVLVPGSLFIGYLLFPLQGFVWPAVSTISFLRFWHSRSFTPELKAREAEKAMEPLGMSLGHDYMGFVVQPLSCSLTLFFASGVAWIDVFFATPVDKGAWGPMRLSVLAVVLTHVQAVLDILTGLKMPRGLALDLQEGRMYWAEDGTMKLRSATLDGQDLQDVPCHV
eukprot:symbB.v1.2.030000.t1/scaffold3336.1/size58873/6